MAILALPMSVAWSFNYQIYRMECYPARIYTSVDKQSTEALSAFILDVHTDIYPLLIIYGASDISHAHIT